MKLRQFALLAIVSSLVTLSAAAQEVAPQVVKEKELLIISPKVINSSRATEKTGPWHIRTALQRIAGEGVDVNVFAKAWFQTWSENEAVSGANDNFEKRPWVTDALQRAWDDDRIKLIAIVNRIDLARFPDNEPGTGKEPTSLGEGRFVYEVQGTGGPVPFTIILEYGLPGDKTRVRLNKWAKDWHALGQIPPVGAEEFSEAYLAKLQALTDEYSAHGTLNQVRTNDFLPGGAFRLWELREFHYTAESSPRLVQAPVAVTPAIGHNGKPELKAFIEKNKSAILDGQHSSIPPELIAAVAPVTSPSFQWNGGGAPARPSFIVSFNTCNGCHGGDTGTRFQHLGSIATESSTGATNISKFLKGPITLDHPLPEQTKSQHDEMAIRASLLLKFTGEPKNFDDPKLRANVKARANRVH